MSVKGKALIILAVFLVLADVAFLVYFLNVPGNKSNEQQKIKVEMANLILEEDDTGLEKFLNSHSTFDVNEDVRPEYSSVQLAAHGSSTDVLDLLIEHGGDLKVKTTTQNMTLLHLSVINGNLEMTEYLLDKGLNINKIDINVYTPLMYAITYGHNEIVDLLIDQGADLSIGDSYGVTPLLMAVQIGDMRNTKLLIDEGADISATAMDGKTAAHFAVFSGSTEMIEYIITECDIDFNCTDKAGNTPLHYAVMRGVGEDFITFLLDSGADDTIKNDKGETPFEVTEANYE